MKSISKTKRVILLGSIVSVLAVISLMASRENAVKSSKNAVPETISADAKLAGAKKWEASPDGINYLKWRSSSSGKKVKNSEDKVRKSVENYTPMEAVVTSLTLPKGSRLGFGIMVRINGEDFILTANPEKSATSASETDRLKSLKVNEKIVVKSRSLSHAPKYAFPILSGDYIERDGELIYKRTFRKNGC